MMRKTYEKPQIVELIVATECLCYTGVSDPEDGLDFGETE